MSEIAQLIQLIAGILQGENQDLRKSSEATLVTLRNDKPNELMAAFIAILDSNNILELHAQWRKYFYIQIQ